MNIFTKLFDRPRDISFLDIGNHLSSTMNEQLTLRNFENKKLAQSSPNNSFETEPINKNQVSCPYCKDIFKNNHGLSEHISRSLRCKDANNMMQNFRLEDFEETKPSE